MCTVLYHKALGLLSKNRDKNVHTKEEIVKTKEFVAIRTIDADYYSLGINQNGCAFVSTAVNSPEWTAVAGMGNVEEAKQIFQKENKGLFSPTSEISKLLPNVNDIRYCIDALMNSEKLWMGYNVVVADLKNAFVIETFADVTHVYDLNNKDVVTNHFKKLNHGAKEYNDYPSSYNRLEYASENLAQVDSSYEFEEIIKPKNKKKQEKIWRTNNFFTISTSIIDLNNKSIKYAKKITDDYNTYS